MQAISHCVLYIVCSPGNQSFRAAVIQSPGPQTGPAKPRQPPQVPPKPGARSREASRERPREPRDAATEENDHLETELKNILRGNKEFDKTNGQGEDYTSDECV